MREAPSAQALKAAKELVSYIETFRAVGTGELMRRYPDDDPCGGYHNIVRRARALAKACEKFDGFAAQRARERLDRIKAGYVEVDPDALLRAALEESMS